MRVQARRFRARAVVLAALALLLPLNAGGDSAHGIDKCDPSVVTFEDDLTGAYPAAFDPVVGEWYVAEVAGRRGLLVNGSEWRPTPSPRASFPLAVYKSDCTGSPISVRFFPISGRMAVAAGIAFDVDEAGSHWAARANARDNTLRLVRISKGRQTLVEEIQTPVRPQVWHTLTVHASGMKVVASLDGKPVLTATLDHPPRGRRCGLVSRADSKVLFDDFHAPPGRP